MKILRKLNPFRRKVGMPAFRYFEGARPSRLHNDWVTGQTSLDNDLRWQLRALIDRSRDLEQNNEYVSGFLRLVEHNILGAKPFTLQMKVLEGDGRHDRNAEQLLEQAWKRWGKPSQCSVTGDLALADIYRLALRSVMRDGATILRKHQGTRFGDFGFQLEVLEVDLLDVEHNGELRNGNEVRMGVEIDEFGKPVAYHLLGSHPGDIHMQSGKTRTRVPAGEIIHPFIKNRPLQTRGYPVFASVMGGLKHLSGYKEAEIVAARTAASKMGFFEKQMGENAQYQGPGADTGGKYMDANPGSLEELPQGLKFVPWDPQHPTSQFGDFVKECLRGVAASLGVSYMTFANDAGDANYSSARIGMLEEREGYKMIQEWFITHICENVFSSWLPHALRVTGLPSVKYDKFNNPYFQGRRWDWVDPRNEVKATIDAIDAGLTSPMRAAAERGMDEEELLDEIEQTLEQRKRLGLVSRDRIDAISGSQDPNIVSE